MVGGSVKRAYWALSHAVVGCVWVLPLASCYLSHSVERSEGRTMSVDAAPEDGLAPRDGGNPEDQDCPFESGRAEDGGSYPFCQWAGPSGYMGYCPPTSNGHYYLNWHTAGSTSTNCDSDDGCNTCVCGDWCDSDWDCPLPSSGDASERCLTTAFGQNGCFLTCDAGEQCPDHMRCVHISQYDRFVCAWFTTGDRCE